MVTEVRDQGTGVRDNVFLLTPDPRHLTPFNYI